MCHGISSFPWPRPVRGVMLDHWRQVKARHRRLALGLSGRRTIKEHARTKSELGARPVSNRSALSCGPQSERSSAIDHQQRAR
jgi:hypothetical protein